MHIVIVEHPRLHSSEHFNDIANTPLCSCLMSGYACAVLGANGFQPEIYDARNLSFTELEHHLSSHPPDFLAIHAVYFWEKTEALFQSIRRLKQKNKRLTICLFGFFPSLVWYDLLEAYPEVDYVIVGEPDLTLAALAHNLTDGKIPAIPGLAGRSDGTPKLPLPPRSVPDPDTLPMPTRPDLDKQKTVSILASRGCYNGCSFCLIPAFSGGQRAWRGRSIGNVIQEIDALKRLGKKDFYFVDPNFIGPGRNGVVRTRHLVEALASQDITFGLETRASDVHPDLTHDLVQAGMTSLLIGLESGCQSVLDRLGKNTTPQQNIEALEIIRQSGLEPEIGFIMFEPNSTFRNISQNLNFLEEARLLDRLSRTVNLIYHQQIALKGTRLYQRALAEKRLTPSGLFGFEGAFKYTDHRVAWLARAIRSLCLKILHEMSRPSSKVFWPHEIRNPQSFQTLNDLVLNQFKDLLRLAASRKKEPHPSAGRAVINKYIAEIDEAINRLTPNKSPKIKTQSPEVEPCSTLSSK